MNFDHSLWGKVVPDGPRFCHWGGKQLSQKLATQLNARETDCVLDLCCGEGGAADFLQNADKVVGIDISTDAILRAQASSSNKKAAFIAADARCLPFPVHTFDKVFAQDADVWMHSDKSSLMQEIARVLKPGGIFLWQSYITREKPLSSKTAKLLQRVGYTCYDMPSESDIPSMFASNGFSIASVESLHSVYVADNLRMLNRAQALCGDSSKHLLALLEWERGLFKKNLWSGILVTAKCNSG